MTSTNTLRSTSNHSPLPASFGPSGAHLAFVSDNAAAVTSRVSPTETSIRIARGATKQMLFIGNGDRLDANKHGSERVCSVEITHQADGKVTLVAREAPFICAIEYEAAGDRWTSYRSYLRYNSLTPDKKQKLLASQRRDGIWTVKFVGRHYKLEIQPGATLVVTHKVG